MAVSDNPAGRGIGVLGELSFCEVAGISYQVSQELASPTDRAAVVGELIMFDISITNSGDVALESVRIEDRYDPSHLEYIAASIDSDDNNDDGVIEWSNIGSLGIGESTTLSVGFVARATTIGAEEFNQVLVVPTVPSNEPDVAPNLSAVQYVIGEPAISIATSVSLDGSMPGVEEVQVTNGAVVTYVFEIVNSGDVDLSHVYMYDYQFEPALSVDIGNLTVGEVVTVLVDSVVNTSLTNESVVVGHDPNWQQVTDSDQAVVDVVQAGFDVSTQLMSPSSRPAEVGEQMTFQVTISNAGDIDLITVPIQYTYETDYLRYVDAVPSADGSNDGEINWLNVGPLAAGESVTLELAFEAISSSHGAARTNTVQVMPTTGENISDLSSQYASVLYEITSVGYDLVKDLISPVGRAAKVGEDVVFEVTVTNTGEVDFVSLSIQDIYETNYLDYVSSTPGSDNNIDDGMINWSDVGPLASGESITLNIAFTAQASSDSELRTNIVVATPITVSGVTLAAKTDSAPYSISDPAFSVVNQQTSPIGRRAKVGELVTFQVEISNVGDVDMESIPVTNTYETSYLSFQGSTPASDDSIDDGHITWSDTGPLASGESVTLDMTFIADASTGGEWSSNVVEITPATAPDKPAPASRRSVVKYKIADARYTLTKTMISPSGQSIYVGETAKFSIEITNDGDVDLVTVPVHDNYDARYLTYVSSTPAADHATDGALVWNDLGPVAAGDSISIVVDLIAEASTTGASETNWVVAMPTTADTEPPLSPQTSSAPYVVKENGFTLTKTLISPLGRPAVIGEELEFRITVSNTGDVELPTVPVVESYDPSYLAYSSSSPAADVTAEGSLSWNNVGPLAAGESETIVVGFTALRSTQPDNATNTVTASPTVAAGAPGLSPQTSAAIYETANPAYQLTKSLVHPTDRPPILGEAIQFEIIVSNTGDVDLLTVPIEDVYDATYLNYVSAIPPTDDLLDDGILTWTNIGSLGVGEEITLEVNFTAANYTDGSETNSVVATPTLWLGSSSLSPQTSSAPYQIDEPITISDYVWEDMNANGVQDDGEPGISDVEVALYGPDGLIVAVTKTDVHGEYIFTNLPPLDYAISITIPDGYVSDSGTSGGGGSGENEVAALYQLASIGDTVWLDTYGDGVQTSDEAGLRNVLVTLTWVDNAGVAQTATRLTAASGYYDFADLEPGLYTVMVDKDDNDLPVSSSLTTPMSYTVDLTSGEDYAVADFGFVPGATITAVELSGFNVERVADGVIISWQTVSEIENLGFNVYRAETVDGPRVQVNRMLIMGQDDGRGALYEVLDDSADEALEYYYWLEDLEWDGDSKLHGPEGVRGENSGTDLVLLMSVDEMGLYKLGYDELLEECLRVDVLDVDKLQVTIDDEEVALFVSTTASRMEDDDYLLFYAPEASVDVRIFEGDEDGVRMEEEYVGNIIEDGKAWLGMAQDAGQLPFVVNTDYDRYFLAGFENYPVWLLDVSVAEVPIMLYGYAVVDTDDGLAIYMSYDAESASCLAVDDGALRDTLDWEVE